LQCAVYLYFSGEEIRKMRAVFEYLEKTQAMEELRGAIEQKRRVRALCVPSGAMENLLAVLGGVTAVYPSQAEARAAHEACPTANKVFVGDAEVAFTRYDAASMDGAQARIEALSRINEKSVVFCSADAFTYKMQPRTANEKLVFKQGDVIPPAELVEKLTELGFSRVIQIETKGEFTAKGEIVEVFSAGMKSPVRIRYFDDEIESVRPFDAATQRYSGGECRAELLPARELLLLENREKICAYLRERGENEAADKLERTGELPGIEGFGGLLENYETLADYQSGAVFLVGAVFARFDKNRSETNEFIAQQTANALAFGCEAECWEDIRKLTEGRAVVDAGENIEKLPEIDFKIYQAAGAFDYDSLANQIKQRTEAGREVYLYAGSRAKELSAALADKGVSAPVAQDKIVNGGCVVLKSELRAGFELEGRLFLSEKDIFGMRRPKKTQKAQKKKTDLLDELRAGDIVTHEAHGKGRFLGLKTMQVDGVSAEYLELQYADGDMLYIKTDQMDRVDKYIGPEGDAAQLSKLGTAKWENAKRKARASVKQMSEDLVALYAERANAKGFACGPDSVWQREFEDSFEYEPTPGQAECIEQIKRDMESDKVMDRLLLADVGYGKTEVAMRACFKAVDNSRQVAVLVPTTLLCRQHFQTFTERFSGYPITIEMLSRYSRNRSEILKRLKNGEIDIIIGTHGLLSKDVKFARLGLLVVDEEQRFGVSHKERIKDMKRSIDVLTLTATPIPRTMEMALTNIRDMSTIDTPPETRKEVAAYVMKFSWELVCDAVERERARGGQVYFVVRLIEQMDEIMLNLKHRLPGVRVTFAHGRQSKAEMESTMDKFAKGEYDVLVATTIIESGIDIPAVNTLIVYQADCFGLAQLYQLKGRVGRSSAKAYAYFTHLGEQLNDDAAKRLSALREFTRLGSGMRVAMRDLQIRGAGNILGAEQSGHMAQIGYSLYIRMLRDAAREITTGQSVKTEATVDLGVEALLPESYIPEQSLRLEIYRKAADIHTAREARELLEEMSERFGTPPGEARNLVTTSVLKEYASKAHVSSVLRKGNVIELKYAAEAEVNLNRLKQLIAGDKGTAVRRSDPPAVLMDVRGKLAHRISSVLTYMAECAKIN